MLGSLQVPDSRSIIIEWARNTLVSGKRPAVAFFYCEHDNPKKQDPRSILATLLYQVLRQLPAGPWDDLELDTFTTTQSVQKLYSSLKAACIHLERIKPAFLIVDALDECDTTTRKRLLPLLVSLGHASRLVLTSRKQGDIEKALQKIPSIAITAKDVDDDINEYVSRKVRLADDEDLSDEFLEVGDPALLEEVSRTLIEGADGMWVFYIECHVRRSSLARGLSGSCGYSCRSPISKNKGRITTSVKP